MAAGAVGLAVFEPDVVAAHHAADAVRKALPDLTYTELAGQQHIAMDTASDLFADTVKGFLLG